MYPVRRSVRYLTGDAALLEDEGAWWLQEASRTPPEPGHAADTRHTLSGGVGGSKSGPRDRIRPCEQFVLFCPTYSFKPSK